MIQKVLNLLNKWQHSIGKVCRCELQNLEKLATENCGP